MCDCKGLPSSRLVGVDSLLVCQFEEKLLSMLGIFPIASGSLLIGRRTSRGKFQLREAVPQRVFEAPLKMVFENR